MVCCTGQFPQPMAKWRRGKLVAAAAGHRAVRGFAWRPAVALAIGLAQHARHFELDAFDGCFNHLYGNIIAAAKGVNDLIDQ